MHKFKKVKWSNYGSVWYVARFNKDLVIFFYEISFREDGKCRRIVETRNRIMVQNCCSIRATIIFIWVSVSCSLWNKRQWRRSKTNYSQTEFILCDFVFIWGSVLGSGNYRDPLVKIWSMTDALEIYYETKFRLTL